MDFQEYEGIEDRRVSALINIFHDAIFCFSVLKLRALDAWNEKLAF